MALTQQFTSGTDATASALNQSSIPIVSATSDITTPITGLLIFNTTDNMIYRYTGSAWTIYNPFSSSVAVAATDTADATTTSTTYTDTTSSSVLSVAFIASPSGKAIVTVTVSSMYAAVASDVRISFRLSGASPLAASDINSSHVFSASFVPGFREVLCTGLTANGSYTATFQQKTSASTGHFLERSIIVKPTT